MPNASAGSTKLESLLAITHGCASISNTEGRKMKNDYPEQLPLARTEQLIVKEVDDEVLVYDLTNDQAHCLNKTAALVWRKCDGQTTVQDIARSLQQSNTDAVDERLVWLALDEMKRFNLLAVSPVKPLELSGLSRRRLMQAMGVAAIALPAVISIVSPTPAQAASPCSAGDTCNNPSDCCTAHPNCVTTGTPSGRGCRP